MADAGPLVRFALESGRFTDSIVKPKLFEPNRRLELSVFRVVGLQSSKIQEIGTQVVERHTTAKRLYGWGKFASSIVADLGLELDNDDTPPRHSNITGWPEEASKRKLLQQKLASQARAVRLARPIEVK